MAIRGQAGEIEQFSAAVREGSNMEMDWLWLATRVESEGARRYCYERALYINPNCEEARRALDAMDEERERTRVPWLRIVRERAQGEGTR